MGILYLKIELTFKLLAYEFKRKEIHMTRVKRGDMLGSTINSYLEALTVYLENFLKDDMCREAFIERFIGRKILFDIDEKEIIIKNIVYT